MTEHRFSLASIARFYAGRPICGKCKCDLIEGANWAPSWKQARKYKCRKCGNAYNRQYFAAKRPVPLVRPEERFMQQAAKWAEQYNLKYEASVIANAYAQALTGSSVITLPAKDLNYKPTLWDRFKDFIGWAY